MGGGPGAGGGGRSGASSYPHHQSSSHHHHHHHHHASDDGQFAPRGPDEGHTGAGQHRRPLLHLVALLANDPRALAYGKVLRQRFLDAGIDVFFNVSKKTIEGQTMRWPTMHITCIVHTHMCGPSLLTFISPIPTSPLFLFVNFAV
jgi:hypothetical protein